MRSFFAFVKKELTEHYRSGRLTVLAIIFVIFGIMNPAIAKITPWMMEALSESLAQSGMTVAPVEIDAMASWTQFFKNIPLALIIFVLMISTNMTKEIQRGTLIPVITKGISRGCIVLSKAAVTLALWLAGFWVCFFITYGYNAYYWDNSVAHYLMLSGVMYCLFGAWIVSLVTLFSSVSSSGTTVLLGTGGSVLALYLVGLIPKVKAYTPYLQSDGMLLLAGAKEPGYFTASAIVALIFSVANIVAAVKIFDKKKI